MRKEQTMSRQKKIAIIVLAVVVLALAAVVGIHIASRFELLSDRAPEGAGQALSRRPDEQAAPAAEEDAVPAVQQPREEEPLDTEDDSEVINTLFYNGQQYVYNEDLTALLILGIDDVEVNEEELVEMQSQADFLLLAVFDPAAETCRLIQINRDTMCDVPVLTRKSGEFTGYYYEQIALAHNYGDSLETACKNTVDAVSHLFYGVEIDNYFSLTMDAIPILNDIVGGITVTIEDDFSAVDPTLVMGETVTLTAENVEHYVRQRYYMGEPTNVARMRRQRTFMTKLFDAMSAAAEEDPGFVLSVYAAVADSLVTDCSLDEINDYAERFRSYELSEIIEPEGEATRGARYMEFLVDEDALQQLVIDTFYLPVEG